MSCLQNIQGVIFARGTQQQLTITDTQHLIHIYIVSICEAPIRKDRNNLLTTQLWLLYYNYLREKGQNYKRNIFPEVRGPVRECEGGWRWRQWWGQTVEVGEEEGSPPGAAERPGEVGRWWWQWPWLDSYQDMWQMMLEIKCQLRKNCIVWV